VRPGSAGSCRRAPAWATGPPPRGDSRRRAALLPGAALPPEHERPRRDHRELHRQSDLSGRWWRTASGLNARRKSRDRR